MILVDSSAWIEFLRSTGSDVNARVRGLVRDGAPLATTEPVVMELLAGVRGPADERRVRGLVAGCTFLRVEAPTDWDRAATLFRGCRANGETVRKTIDCLIAAVAVRNDAELLHRDADFDVLARHTELRVA